MSDKTKRYIFFVKGFGLFGIDNYDNLVDYLDDNSNNVVEYF